METSLNQNQLEAVNHTEGPLLILAGAGSGKTRVLTYRVAHLINNGVKPYNILAITFTNKAADEMRKRVDQTTNNMGSDVWVSTFHSLCVRILRKNIDKLGFANNFTIYDTDDQKQVIKRIIKNLNLDPKQWKEKSAIAKISNAKEQMINEIEYENSAGSNFPNQIYAKIYKAYQLELKNNNALDFDDLLSKTVELFNKFPEVLEKYQDRFKYIMVDEYQDTNGVQFLLVKQLASKYNNICVVGDDDQSIYKFRGADIRNILDFEKFFPDTYVIKLEDNYRSTSYILNAANGVISNNSKRKSKTLRASRGSGDLVSFNWYNTAEEEASDIIDEIARSVARNKSVYSDNAILYRTNAQSRLFEEELVRQNIPYRLIGGINFYSRKEIKDILAYLKTIENGSDNISLRRIINIPKRGIGNTTIEKILEIGNEYNQSMWETLLNSDNIISLARAKSKLAEFTELIKDMKKNASNSNSVLSIIDMVLDKTGYIKELEMENTDESRARIENIQEFRNKASLFDKQAETDSSNLLTQFLEEVALIADIDNLNNSENRVVLMTLHGSKGLEFPNVYMTGMEEEIFPSYISINSDNEDDIEEERRLCYVGITRAMNHLNLSGARNRFIHGRSCYTVLSRFVQEIPKECLESPSAVEEATSDFVDDEDTYGYTEKPYNKFNFKNNYYKPHNNSYGSFGSYDIDDNNTNISYNKNLENNAFINKGSSFTKADVDELDYNVGDRVSHKKFGEGIVSLIEEGARDYKVTIEFDNGETRTMLAGFARLEKID